MIVRAWLISGMLIIGIAWFLTVSLSPPDFQGSAPTSINAYREAGLMPAAGSLVISKEIGHDVFEVPKTDADHVGDSPMAGMGRGSMSGMSGMDMKKMPGMGQEKMTGMEMKKMPGMADEKMPGMEMKKMPGMADEKMTGMDMQKMPGMAEEKMSGMDMKKMPGMPDEKMSGMDMKKMPGMAEEKDHGDEAAKEEGGHDDGGESGLEILKSASAQKVDRTVEIKMAEWGYTPGNVNVKEGEVIRLVLVNAGNTPHEFMLMTGPAMGAVGYRVNRADWNLTEHKAIYEKPLIMPGDSFEVVVKINKPGAWMFMCMFPYHMRLGMMGGLATEGMQGMMMNMGGMKM